MVETADRIEMKVPSKPEYVGVVRLTVSGIANRLGCSYDDIEDIKIAIAEACTNVVNHAYATAEADNLIHVSFEIFENRLELTVSDNGGKVDINRISEGLGPVTKDDIVQDLKEGGLGLFLIETLMDKVEITGESGVKITMTKFLQRDGVELDGNGAPQEI